MHHWTWADHLKSAIFITHTGRLSSTTRSTRTSPPIHARSPVPAPLQIALLQTLPLPNCWRGAPSPLCGRLPT